jgi:hypothetical protein
VTRSFVKLLGLSVLVASAVASFGVGASGATSLAERSVAASTAGSGSGYLSVFQEASSTPLDVSIDGATPTSLAKDKFTSIVISSGTHTITASSGSTTIASGEVAVPAGQHVTALVYVATGGVATITGFTNDETLTPSGESRVVFRNTADSSPLDIYLNGVKVASGLEDNQSAPTSSSILVKQGTVDFAVTDAGAPLSDALSSQQGTLVAGDLLNVFVVGDETANPSTIGIITNAIPLGAGYRLYASDGGVFNFGDSSFYGSTGGKHLNEPIVGAAPTSVGVGYWLVASDGGVFSFGDATFFGSMGGSKLNKPVVGMAGTPDEGGYWLVASDGGIFTFGDATFYGSTGAIRLNEPIVGMAATPDGKGYWLVASDGGIFSFGDATFYGSTGNLTLNKPIVSMIPTVDGRGYWLVASDGAVFSFGDAAFYGSTGNLTLNKPIVSASTPGDLLPN